jgi:hypothetical protein
VRHWGDDIGEMPTQRLLDDASVEAILGGRQVPSELEPLASAVGALRETARQTVRPSAELSAFMAAGGFDRRREQPLTGWQAASAKLAGTSLRLKLAAAFAAGLTGLTGVAAAAREFPQAVQASVQTAVAFVPPMELIAEPAQDGATVEQTQEIDGRKFSRRARGQGDPPKPVLLPDILATPTPTPSPVPEVVGVPQPDGTPSATPTPTPTSTPTPTPTESPTPSPTPEPTSPAPTPDPIPGGDPQPALSGGLHGYGKTLTH